MPVFLFFFKLSMTVVWPDWSRLVNDGDAKAIGLPRSDEERAVLETLADKNERAKVIAELRAGTYKIQAPSTETDKYKNITKKMLQDALAQAGIEANGLDKKSDLIALFEESGLKIEDIKPENESPNPDASKVQDQTPEGSQEGGE